ncbi:MAG: SHOCT domain-containing protein [Lachnospiraceae bacterium]|nr:SHOCT domain-containing protein [Lachnospiraceae bacterium]
MSKKSFRMVAAFVFLLSMLLTACSSNPYDRINAIAWGTIIFYTLLCIGIQVAFGFATKKVIENKGYRENWFWWGFFFGLIALIVAFSKPEKNSRNTPAPVYTAPVKSETDKELDRINKLKGYKELLDSGAITQEEFDAQKAKIFPQPSAPKYTSAQKKEPAVPKAPPAPVHKSYREHIAYALKYSTDQGMLNYLSNSAMPDLSAEEKQHLEGILAHPAQVRTVLSEELRS